MTFEINWQVAYVALSALVAVAIWIQNTILKKNNGKLPDTPIFYVLSMLDTAWVVISAVAMYFLSFYSIVMSIPVAYAIYTVSAWVYAARTMNGGEIPTTPDDIVFDKRYLDFCQSFSVAFFVLCAVVLFVDVTNFSLMQSAL